MVVTHPQKSMNCKQILFLQHLLQKPWLKFFFSKTKKYNDDNYRKKNNEKIHKTEHVINILVCKRRTNTCIYTVILTLMFTCKITTLWIPRRNIQLNGRQMFQDILSVRKMFVYLYLILIWLRNLVILMQQKPWQVNNNWR